MWTVAENRRLGATINWSAINFRFIFLSQIIEELASKSQSPIVRRITCTVHQMLFLVFQQRMVKGTEMGFFFI